MANSFNSGSRSGNFLCSGRRGDFNATGELGQPVYSVAIALREAIRRSSKTEPPLAYFLAIPQPDETGEHIDWYADPCVCGPTPDGAAVINWNNATEAEKAAAKPKLLAFEESVNAFSARLLQNSHEGTGDKHTFAKLLPKVLTTPSRLVEAKGHSQERYILDPSYVFLVGPDQQPVLAFWGFSHPQSATSTEPFHFLNTPSAALATAPQAVPAQASGATLAATAPIAPMAAVPVATASRHFDLWRILRWLLLLLLLLLALFFAWRSCTQPTLPTLPGLGVHSPNTGANAFKQPGGFNPPTISWPGFMAKWGIGSGTASGVALPDMPAPAAANNATMPVIPDLAAPAAQPTPPPQPSSGTTPVDIATPANLPSPAALAADTGMATPPLAQLGPELHIPPDLSNQAVPSYINGQWQVHAIQDQQTGRPVRLEYAIQDGQGQVRIQQGNGISCQGPVQATGQGSGLLINSLDQAHCDDGSRYQMPEVQCHVNANQDTECLGRYDGNPAFPISMRHATE